MNGEERRVEQEARDLRGKRLVLIGVLAIGVFGAAVWANAEILRSRRGALRDVPAPVLRPAETLHGLERSRIDGPGRGLGDRRGERRRLQSYGWVDEARGIAHIPIERAIDWLVQDLRDGGVGRLGAVGVDGGGAVAAAAAADAAVGAEAGDARATEAPKAGAGSRP